MKAVGASPVADSASEPTKRFSVGTRPISDRRFGDSQSRFPRRRTRVPTARSRLRPPGATRRHTRPTPVDRNATRLRLRAGAAHAVRRRHLGVAPSRPPARHIMASLARPGVAYTLRGALYLALTNQTNATPLTRLRTRVLDAGVVKVSVTDRARADRRRARRRRRRLLRRAAAHREQVRFDSPRARRAKRSDSRARTKGLTVDDARAAARATRASSSRDTANRCCATTRCATRCERC